jgi:hypothetical protein
MNESEIVWQLVKDNFEQARAHEQYRANIAALVITLVGILVGTLSITGLGSHHRQIVYLAIAVLGLYGALASAKHYERFRMHVAIAQHFVDKLRELKVLSIDVNDEFRKFQTARKWRHSWLAALSLNWLWTGFPAALGLVGLVMFLRTL